MLAALPSAAEPGAASGSASGAAGESGTAAAGVPPGAADQEAKAELVAMELGDSDVSLFMTGSWKGTFSASGGFELTELGTRFTSAESPILFEQETDLTLELLILDRWFVEASFLDDYDLNTYRAGYRGKEGEVVQYVGVGNTGLDFPAFPYLDLGGDAPNSFGVYGAFAAGALRVHTLFRYDAATREEKVFVGDRERTTADVGIGNRLRGRSFVLPDEGLDAAPVVYIEDSGGAFSGGDGRKYRRAAPSEHASSATYGIVELSESPAGRVAVTYSKGGNAERWAVSLGSYGSGSGFLGQAQAAFSAVDPAIDLSDYPQPGDDAGAGAPATITIEGTKALVIYEKGAFSPFERGNRYVAPDSSAAASASVVKPSTGTVIGDYALTDLKDIARLEFPSGAAALTAARTVYELASSRGTTDRRSVSARWPLLAEAPEIYLSGTRETSADIAIRFTTYGASGAYAIGTDVVPGSVEVRRNGFVDALARYDEESGTVILQSPALASEIIRISYLKRADERRFGSLAAGLGVEYAPEGPFSARGALGARWNVSGESYSESGATNPGSVGLSAGADWKYENLQAGLTIGLTYDQPDTTGLYRVTGMEGAEIRHALDDAEAFPAQPPPGDAVLPALDAEEAYPLPFRNYVETDLLGGTTLKTIEWTGAKLVSGADGPYAVSDASVSGEILVAEFALDDAFTWAGFQARLGEDAAALERAKRIVLPYRFYDFSATADFEVYVQFGALADREEGDFESSALTYSALIYDSTKPAYDGTTPGSAWRTAVIDLDDAARRRLADVRSIRIVIRFTAPPDADDRISGRLLVAGPTSMGASFRAVTAGSGAAPKAAPDGASTGVAVTEDLDASLRAAYPSEIDKLHPDHEDQRVLKIAWGANGTGVAAGADGRTEAVPLADYRTLVLYVRGPAAKEAGDAAALRDATLRVALARGPSSLALSAAAKETPLNARVPVSAFKSGTWSRLEVIYGGDEPRVRVDGATVSGAEVSFRSGALAVSGGADPGYVAVLVEPRAGTALPAGSFAVDELTLEDPAPSYGAKLGGTLAWQRKGAVLSAGSRPLVADLATEAAFESSAYGDPFAGGSVNGASVAGRGAAAATVLGSRLSGTLASTTGPAGTTWSASHAAAVPVGPLSVQEAFAFAPNDGSLERDFGATLSGPLTVAVSGNVDGEAASIVRTWQGRLAASVPLGGSEGGSDAAPKLSAQSAASAAWTENEDGAIADLVDYAEAWRWSWRPLTPDEGGGARERALEGTASFAVEARPLGVALTATGNSDYTASSGMTESKSQVGLEFPAVFKPVSGKLVFHRTFSRVMEGDGSGVYHDLELFRTSVRDAFPLWTEPPVRTLWLASLEETLIDAADSGAEATFRDSLALSLTFPQAQGPAALVLPVAFQSSVERVLDRTYDTISDSLVTAGSLNFTAINLFGAFGTRPVFNFYQSDEYTHSIEAQAIFGDAASTTWQTTFRQGAAFYGFAGARLGFSNTLIIAQDNWSEGALISWTAPAPKNFVGAVYGVVIEKFKGNKDLPAVADLTASPPIRERRETLEFSYSDDAEAEAAWSCSLKHESLVRVAGTLTLNAFIQLIAAGSEAAGTFAFTATTGTSLTVTY